MIEAQLPDGRILEFPDGTSSEVIQGAVKKILGGAEPRSNIAAIIGESFLKGISNVAGIPGDINKLFDTAMEPVGDLVFGKKSAKTKAFEERVKPDLSGAGLRKGMTQAGVIGRPEAQPQTPGQKFLAAGVEGATSAPFGPAAMIAGAGSGLGAEAVKQAGGGELAQVAGSVAGGVVTGTAVNQTLKLANTVAGQPGTKTLEAMRTEGVTPRMVGDAAESKVAKQATAMMRDAPVTGNIIQKAAQETTDELAAAVERRASQMAPATTPAEAGQAIEAGVKGYINKVGMQADRLYAALGTAVPGTTPIAPTNTLNAVGNLTSTMPGLTKTAGELTPKLFKNLTDDLTNPQLGGNVSWQAMSRLRTEVGKRLSDPMLVDDVSRADMKRLYGALTDDMRNAAAAQSPQALNLFEHSNKFYRDQMQFVEKSFQKLADAGVTPERLFGWATAEGRQGATRLAALKKAMGPDFNNISAVVLNKIGRAGGNGEFSASTFFNNWDKTLSSDAKNVMFQGGHREAVDRLALIAKEMRDTGALTNPSRTAGTATMLGWLGAFGASSSGGTLLGGVPGAAAGIGTQILTQASISKLLTNPTFAKWLATPVGPNGIPGHLKLLVPLVEREPHLADAVNEFTQFVGQQGGK
jgi:hypothetical protein